MITPDEIKRGRELYANGWTTLGNLDPQIYGKFQAWINRYSTDLLTIAEEHQKLLGRLKTLEASILKHGEARIDGLKKLLASHAADVEAAYMEGWIDAGFVQDRDNEIDANADWLNSDAKKKLEGQG